MEFRLLDKPNIILDFNLTPRFFPWSLFEGQKVTKNPLAVIQSSNWLFSDLKSGFSVQFDFLSFISAKIWRISLASSRASQILTASISAKKTVWIKGHGVTI